MPLYVVAFTIGEWLIGKGATFTPPPEFVDVSLLQWLNELTGWMIGLGEPLALGLLILSSTLAVTGYVVVRGLWRLHLVRAWEARKRKRNSVPK